ncbi:unnamed protein product [Adineta steineri]|uniref:G-protein coupled receptors family 1 profile domain-containing protein n=1 Tax=Adineta steineri TaxID=433720 RepID=A0A820DE72_9BILA|nr:unnamed protein product [Adineta steineri]
MSLLYIGQQLTCYLGPFILIIGIVGDGINIIVFSSIRSYRTNPCTFYFLVAAVFNFLYIAICLSSRIAMNGFGYDLTRISISWCKIRWFIVYTFGLSTLTFSSLATIDQYFVTSQSAYLRRLSNIKWAHRITIIVIIIWCLHNILLLLFYSIPSGTMACTITNSIFAAYIPPFYLIFVCTLPVIIMALFGYLSYRNIQLTRVLSEQQADRQLVKMTLIQVVLVAVCIGPSGIINAYGLITSGVSKGTDRLNIENFISSMTSLISFLYFSGSCYMFLISSSRFRQAVKGRILFWLRSNQIVAVQQPINEAELFDKRIKN